MTVRVLVAALALTAAAIGAQTPEVSFHKDVEPILQKNCQSCHRSGQMAPMSFVTYESTRPWARAMKARSNPNPNRTVYYGSMTWEEMMNPFYGVVVDRDVDPRTIVRSKYQQVGGGG